MEKPQCAKCKPRPCTKGITEEKKLPEFCPIKNSAPLIERLKPKYKAKETCDFYLKSALIEKQGYDEKAVREQGRIVPVRPRIREVYEFAVQIGAKRIGMAFCSGLAEEAARINHILEGHGLEVISVICSCGAVDKTELGIPSEFKIRNPEKFEAACNPLLQAELLNRNKTSFNILVGLCVGHDMMFTSHSKAPVTTLIVKDRFAGHNPVITLYSRYFRDLV